MVTLIVFLATPKQVPWYIDLRSQAEQTLAPVLPGPATAFGLEGQGRASGCAGW